METTQKSASGSCGGTFTPSSPETGNNQQLFDFPAQPPFLLIYLSSSSPVHVSLRRKRLVRAGLTLLYVTFWSLLLAPANPSISLSTSLMCTGREWKPSILMFAVQEETPAFSALIRCTGVLLCSPAAGESVPITPLPPLAYWSYIKKEAAAEKHMRLGAFS